MPTHGTAPGSLGAGHLRFPIMGPDMDLAEWVTQDEVAAFMGVSTTTVKRWRLDGRLAYRPGRPVRIQWAAVQDFIRNSEVRVTWEGGVRQFLPASSQTRGLLSTGPASGKSGGQKSTQRAVLALAVSRAKRGIGT